MKTRIDIRHDVQTWPGFRNLCCCEKVVFHINLHGTNIEHYFNVSIPCSFVTWFLTAFLTPCFGKPLNEYICKHSEDPNEMQHNAAFHQGLRCL